VLVHDYLWGILHGAWISLQLAIYSLVLAIILGLLGALARQSHSLFLRVLADAYSMVVRGVPDLVWMFLLFFGVQMLINQWVSDSLIINPFAAGVLAIGFIFGAYMAETFRGALLSVPKGQSESAQAYGLSSWDSFVCIIFPQMVRYALPGFSNNWLTLLKSTAVVSVIGLNDMMYMADSAKNATQKPFTIYVYVALIYLVLTVCSELLIFWIRRRFSKGVSRTSMGEIS
jgi:arginine/ornithine transport system permease protein